MSETRYLEPGIFVKHGFNRLVRRLARMGISVAGSRELRIVGRKSGEVRSVVVNRLDLEGTKYLVSPRGHTEWVRNLRAAGGKGELRVGRRVEPFQATELADDAKIPVIRAYLDKWGWEVGQFFEDLKKDSSDEEIAAVAPGFPAFSLA